MLIIYTGISTNTINLINENSQFEYILFDQKEDTIFENEENFIVIYEEDYLEINNLLKLKKSKKQVYFIGIFKEGNIDLIKKLVNLDVLDYIFDTSKDSISSLINKIKSKNNKKIEVEEGELCIDNTDIDIFICKLINSHSILLNCDRYFQQYLDFEINNYEKIMEERFKKQTQQEDDGIEL